MAASGLGDMLAKYISICEWRIGNVVTGEYYCEEVASIIRYALSKCIENADNVSENLHGDVEIFYKDGSVQKILSTISDGNTSIRELIEGCVLTA